MSSESSSSSSLEDRISGCCIEGCETKNGSVDGIERRKHRKRQMKGPRVAMVSDFFYPGLGGVEMHIYQLSQCLMELGFYVIVITHYRGDRMGIRYMTNGLKVYYLPYKTFVDQCTPPAFITYFALMRQILIRERIDIVHGHQATSALCQEMCFHARTMGYKTVYTDHSLFGFGDASCIAINKVLKVFLTDVHHCICVSHTNKENLILRAAIRPDDVSVIPNAVDASRFTPNPSPRVGPLQHNSVSIVVVSRLTFRKGIDILIDVMPEISRRFPYVHWIIAGDGPKRMDIEQMLERHKLHDRTELLGKVPHSQVRDVLLRGDIFLNCSLTEAFCIAIVEAASCGLCVVSTDVGGVPEVLPPSMIRLCPPNAEKFVEAVSETITEDVPYRDRWDQHRRVSEMYSWDDVARRTADVYKKVMDTPDMTLKQRIRLLHTTGPALGKICVLMVVFSRMMCIFFNWLYPVKRIEKSVDFPFKAYRKHERLGTHHHR
ncbi:hypothetical protein FOL47_003284 [Perkinsus chesapeaki]|uniref:phosphatidylinositol N-acetylglucosaminyltransferase n=1 Tax=Perkinsus chesapeaki TaxID=330153 RepID=A0A7J6N2T2_PERCH|nr:hypothetical protein FOL47_003284 [Perkinsus chesapeaki]